MLQIFVILMTLFLTFILHQHLVCPLLCFLLIFVVYLLTPEEDNFCRKHLCTIVFLCFIALVSTFPKISPILSAVPAVVPSLLLFVFASSFTVTETHSLTCRHMQSPSLPLPLTQMSSHTCDIDKSIVLLARVLILAHMLDWTVSQQIFYSLLHTQLYPSFDLYLQRKKDPIYFPSVPNNAQLWVY